MKKRFVLLMMLALPLALAGCNTMKGMGSDLQEGGQALERAVH